MTIGLQGGERVDYITYDTKGIWRCYEIKVSKSDFYSDAKKTFVGHYNYFVMPEELFEEVKHDIPEHVGVYAYGYRVVKRAKRQELLVDEHVLKDSLIRSLYRQASKLKKLENPYYVEQTETRIRSLEKTIQELNDRYNRLMNIGYEKYGAGWHRE